MRPQGYRRGMIRKHHDHAECAIISDEQTANINNEWLKREHSRRGYTHLWNSITEEVTKMKNIRKTTDWMEMALEDMDAAVADVTEERYPASVFHAQQCTEKLLKAVLYFFGIIHEKTHFPSDILAEDILNNPEMTREFQLDKEKIELLLKMVDNASSLEKHRSMPRYGWETKDRIIKPSEIYDELKAKEIMNQALKTLDAVYAFFKSLDMVELEDVLVEMERCLKR